MTSQTLPNSLPEVLQLDKVVALSPQEIEYIWLAKTANSEQAQESPLFKRTVAGAKVAAVIPSGKFEKLEKIALKNKQFILPVHNEQLKQLDIHYLQWQYPNDAPNTVQLIFTKLADFQRLGAQAPPHTVVYFYKDLAGEAQENSLDKGLVLMKGEILDPQAVDVHQVQFLILNVQKFYGVLDESSVELRNERLKTLLSFNTGDPSFSFDKLISLAMNVN